LVTSALAFDLDGDRASWILESRLGVTTSLSRLVDDRSAHRPTAVETQPNVWSEPCSGRAEAKLQRTELSHKAAYLLGVALEHRTS
jgi:hypothetical protein